MLKIIHFMNLLILTSLTIFIAYLVLYNSTYVVLNVLPSIGSIKGYSYNMPLYYVMILSFISGILFSLAFIILFKISRFFKKTPITSKASHVQSEKKEKYRDTAVDNTKPTAEKDDNNKIQEA